MIRIQRPWPWQSLNNTRLDWTQTKDAIQEEIASQQKECIHKGNTYTSLNVVNSKACSIRVHADTQIDSPYTSEINFR